MTNVASITPSLYRLQRFAVTDYLLSSAFQPIFSPSHQRLVGFEALLRAKRDGESVSPAEVFKRALDSGQTQHLDRRLQSLHIQRFAESGSSTWLFLNISPASCVDAEESLAHLESSCDLYDVNPAQVVLEVVETETENKAELLKFARLARARGFRIAIDDFGVGDSNFERVWQLEPLIIKIDRSLLVNAAAHRRARQLLNGLVSMIRESGSLVLIEGIETEKEARIAISTGADLLQGFLFGRPASLIEVLENSAAGEKQFSHQIAQIRMRNEQDCRYQEGFLRLLRVEFLDACLRLSSRTALADACAGLLEIAGVKRCFVLDEDGIQQGGLASETSQLTESQFNPLYQSSGACWSHREYFRRALERPHIINASRPYVALPDAMRTVTLSACVQQNNQTKVFCVDVHPDSVFDGQLAFPDAL